MGERPPEDDPVTPLDVLTEIQTELVRHPEVDVEHYHVTLRCVDTIISPNFFDNSILQHPDYLPSVYWISC